MLSCVLILPMSQVTTGNTVGLAMGWGPASYTVPLTSGSGVTHMGLHAWTTEGFQALVESGEYQPELAQAGITEATYNAMMASLIASFRDDYTNHFNEVIEANGLQVAEP